MTIDTWKYDNRAWYPGEAALFLGNGYIGGDVPIDGHGAEHGDVPATMAAFYVGRDEAMPGVPHWLNVPIEVNGHKPKQIFVDYRQVLDLRGGTMLTAYNEAEGCVRIETETFCHRARRSLTPYRITITAMKDARVVLKPQLNRGSCRRTPEVRKIDAKRKESVGWLLDFDEPERRVGQMMTLKAEPVASVEPFKTEGVIGFTVSASLKPGESCSVEVAVSTCVGTAPDYVARTTSEKAVDRGFDSLKKEQGEAMEKLWEEFDIKCDDPHLERRLHAAMFYVLTNHREDVVWGGTITGLSSRGHGRGSCCFRDVEFYVFPALVMFYPELARNTLIYRYNTLPGALHNAKEHGEQGARYARQSSKTGRERAPLGFGDERHVSTDVAYCMWWYAQVTDDADFMKRCGREVIIKVALNVASRAKYNKEKKRYELHGVVPPDEHVPDHYVGKPVNNSVMTNFYGAWVLRKAIEVGGNVLDEALCEEWRAMADGLYLPRDDEQGIYLEYEGYNGHPVKQADVGHLFFPVAISRDAEEIRRNVYYYAAREVENGLYLMHGPLVYAAALSRAGDVAGVRHFLELAGRNWTAPHDMPRESNYGGACYVPTAGVLLGIVLYGLLGIEFDGQSLSAHSCVPPELGSITVSGLKFKGKRYRISARAGKDGQECDICEEGPAQALSTDYELNPEKESRPLAE